MRFIFSIVLALVTLPASAQVRQSGTVTPGHVAMWTTNGIVQDGGTAAIPFLTSLGVVASGPGLCQNSGPVSGPYNALCFAPTSTGGGFTWFGYGGASGVPSFNINGTIYPFPFSSSGIIGPATTISGDLMCWNNTVGTLAKDCGLSIGTPTTNELLYFSSASLISGLATADNAVLGTNGSGVPSVSSTLPSGLTIPGPTVSGTVNFTGTFEVGGTAQTFPASGLLVGTTDTQTLSAKTLTSPTINGGALSGTLSGTPTLSGSNFVTLANIVQASAYTLDGNATGSTANRTDFTIGSLTAKVAPTTSDLVVISDQAASGALKQATLGTLPGIGNFVLLNTLTASNSATLSDTTSLTNAYSNYKIVFENIIPATTERTLQLQVHSGGAYKTTGYLNTSTAFSTGGATISNPSTFISLNYATPPNALNAANAAPGYSGEITVTTPSANTIANWFGMLVWISESSVSVNQLVAGQWNTAGVIDGFQVSFDSGNITSGVIKIYGIQ